MTQGTRPDGVIFASDANDGELESFPAESRGWGVTIDGKDGDGSTVTDATGGIPPMEWMNGILNKLSAQIYWNMQNAIPAWAAGTWGANAFVTYSGWVYYNVSGAETAGEPSLDTAWEKMFPLSSADDRYLQTQNNLSEIAEAGADAQSESRGHLGLGDIATHDAGDFVPTSGGEIDGNLAISGSLNVGGVTTAQSLTAEGAVELCNYAVSTSRATDNALIQCFDFAGVVAYGYGYYENKFCVASYNDDGSFNKIILSVDKDGNMNIPGTLYTDVDVVSSYLTVTTQNVTLEQKINNEIEAVRNIAFELQCKQLIGNVTPEETQYMTALATYVSTLRNNPDQPRPQLEV